MKCLIELISDEKPVLMANEVTRRFIECYKELRTYNDIRSDRQFCAALDYSPQSWIKILKGERDATIELIRVSMEIFGFNPVFLFSGIGPKFCENELQKDQEESPEQKEKKIIHIPVTAKAGYTDQINEPVYTENLRLYSLPLDYFRHGNFRSFEVEGDSMEPVLSGGDIVICSQLEDKSLWQSNIRNGYVYVVIFRDDILVKRVYNHIREEGKILLSSDNSGYPEIVRDIPEVYEIWLVKMRISSFAHSKVNLRQELTNQISEMQNLMKIQSERIVGMQAAMEKMLQKNRNL